MLTTRYAHITGWGSYAPPRVVTNEELATLVPTSDEWIRDRTGIGERRISDDQDFTSTMATRASRRALKMANLPPDRLGLVILASATPDHMMPNTATMIQNALGATNAATAMIRTGMYETALVIGAESLSRVTNWTDRNTCVLFGDGAGAVVLEASDLPGGVLSSEMGADGSGGDLITIGLGTRNLAYVDSLPPGENYIKMKGREVFRFATRIMEETTRKVVADAGLELDDIDLVIPHQANDRILQTAAKRLGIPRHLMYSNVARYGNTSAASVPLAIVDAVSEGHVRSGDHIVLVGFGGGLTWAGCVVKWTYDPADRQWSAWRRGVLWSRYRLAGVKSWVNRADRQLAAVEDKLRRRDSEKNGRGSAAGSS
jgi:3-oxoacyl-[acyl-carrier-protein] synthase-3